ncbi:MAG: hypothetical protein DMG51_06660 [Acidobacteria bacterium]|nr:MAG: hypothetical protein DMG51_06660 [Acidobacteriota bacterium]
MQYPALVRLLDLLTAKPQDMTHSDYALPTQPALHRLKEIRVPTPSSLVMRIFLTYMPMPLPSKQA